ncbi:MAG: PAS domain-containing protein [Candidatus Thiodiazotropha sp. (ex Ustalcina ferruginea)]|nr:PAS domain-containing protein [Candidatus Thiodiazotropha sp. (ex Ustalcina ferruginea)]
MRSNLVVQTRRSLLPPRWKSTLGFEETELDNSLDTWKTLVHPDDKDWVPGKVEDFLTGKTESFEDEIRKPINGITGMMHLACKQN